MRGQRSTDCGRGDGARRCRHVWRQGLYMRRTAPPRVEPDAMAPTHPAAAPPESRAMASSAPPVVVIAVGDELLSGHTQDTNSNFLARRLFEAGNPVRRIEVVADADQDIALALRRALAEPGVRAVVLSGGIGPTPDDRTFAAVAGALDLPLQVHPGAM